MATSTRICLMEAEPFIEENKATQIDLLGVKEPLHFLRQCCLDLASEPIAL
jgi:hypothetical protein